MNTRVLLLGCLLALSVQAQESRRDLWTWKDANGVTQYSDRPVPGARKVELATSSPSVPAPAPAARAGTPPAKPGAASTVQYQSLEIWSPDNGESFFGADATVNVRMRSEPTLASGDRLLLYLDGKLAVEGAASAYEHTLTNLDRGVHSLSAVILDTEGNEKIRSEPRVFHIKQPTTIAPRAVGPSLKPTPPPSNPQPRSNSPR